MVNGRCADAANPRRFSPQQIETYCGCFASASVAAISDEDVAYTTDHLGSFPPGLTDRMKPIATACVKVAKGTPD